MQSSPINVAVVGLGNLGRAVCAQVDAQPDMRLAAIVSRRAQQIAASEVKVVSQDEAETLADIDLWCLCLGSATDIPELAPQFARLGNTVDTYDNHSNMVEHRQAMQQAASQSGHLAVIGSGWDPGLFSVQRTMHDALFVDPKVTTFWGPGVSQGHSDAVRRIAGVKRAVQYTLPNEDALQAVRNGEEPSANSHRRHVVVVAEPADRERIESEIRTMPAYFAGQDVEVEWVDEQTFDAEHTDMPHGGYVLASGELPESRASIEYQLTLGRNPDFTAAAQVAYGRAAVRLARAGEVGARTVLEVAPYLLSPTPLDELVSKYV